MPNSPVPSMGLKKARPGQERYVSPTDETGLGAVDAVADDSAPSSMWGEAWKNLRTRPLFWVALTIITLAVLLSLFPSWFTSQNTKFTFNRNASFMCILNNFAGQLHIIIKRKAGSIDHNRCISAFDRCFAGIKVLTVIQMKNNRNR